jgi:hypothetical protein
LAHVPGQYQLIPHIDEVIRTNETTNVVVVALAENLFIHPCSLLAIGKVVVTRRANSVIWVALPVPFLQTSSIDVSRVIHSLVWQKLRSVSSVTTAAMWLTAPRKASA